MITKYDQQYEQDCEALEKAEQVRNQVQWEVVKCQRKVEETRLLMRQEVAEQIRQAANLPEKTKAQENAEEVVHAYPNGRYSEIGGA